MHIDRRRAIPLILLGLGATTVNPAAALEACVPVSNTPKKADVTYPNACDREVRIAYLAGAYKQGEPVVAALTDRTVDLVIEGINPIKVKVGPLNNSGVAEDDAAEFRRSLLVGGLTLNYIAVPVGERVTVSVGIHRLNANGTRRADEQSNPPYQIVDTCLIHGGPDMNTLAGLSTIQVFSQNSRLGDGPGDYRNSKNDLVFQDSKMLFQGVELGYLLGR